MKLTILKTILEENRQTLSSIVPESDVLFPFPNISSPSYIITPLILDRNHNDCYFYAHYIDEKTKMISEQAKIMLPRQFQDISIMPYPFYTVYPHIIAFYATANKVPYRSFLLLKNMNDVADDKWTMVTLPDDAQVKMISIHRPVLLSHSCFFSTANISGLKSKKGKIHQCLVHGNETVSSVEVGAPPSRVLGVWLLNGGEVGVILNKHDATVFYSWESGIDIKVVHQRCALTLAEQLNKKTYNLITLQKAIHIKDS